jgi:hypothetical protein
VSELVPEAPAACFIAVVTFDWFFLISPIHAPLELLSYGLSWPANADMAHGIDLWCNATRHFRGESFLIKLTRFAC